MWCMFESLSSFDSVGSWEATRIFTVPIFYDADDVNEPIEKTDVLKILVCMTSAPHICAVVTVSIETGVHVNNGRTARRIRSRTNTSLLIARFWCARKSLALLRLCSHHHDMKDSWPFEPSVLISFHLWNSSKILRVLCADYSRDQGGNWTFCVWHSCKHFVAFVPNKHS